MGPHRAATAGRRRSASTGCNPRSTVGLVARVHAFPPRSRLRLRRWQLSFSDSRRLGAMGAHQSRSDAPTEHGASRRERTATTATVRCSPLPSLPSQPRCCGPARMTARSGLPRTAVAIGHGSISTLIPPGRASARLRTLRHVRPPSLIFPACCRSEAGRHRASSPRSSRRTSTSARPMSRTTAQRSANELLLRPSVRGSERRRDRVDAGIRAQSLSRWRAHVRGSQHAPRAQRPPFDVDRSERLGLYRRIRRRRRQHHLRRSQDVATNRAPHRTVLRDRGGQRGPLPRLRRYAGHGPLARAGSDLRRRRHHRSRLDQAPLHG